MARIISTEEVAKHSTPEDCWIIINGKVYDVTKFAEEHPGGKKVLLRVAGKDASKEFEKFHNVASVLAQYGPNLYIGDLGSATSKGAGEVAKKVVGGDASGRIFGEEVPYGDPSWYQGWNARYYNDSHKRFRAVMREFVEKELMPFAHEWDESKAIPLELFKKSYEAGWLPAITGKKWPTKHAGTRIAGGVKPEEYDAFHELIAIDEVCRSGSAGIAFSLLISLNVGLPPILHFGSTYLQDKVCADCLTGRKRICLAITEPSAGSDVAALVTEAKKTPCGKYYILNGEKKWITGGTFADYFTVAVRTGGPGAKGISMLLVERGPGVTTRHMPCQGLWSGGTAYVTFEDVKVPVENLIGEENQGFKYIMYNFNHERWAMCIQAIRFARVCYEESFKYAHKRKTFGKRLVDHPVIRLKLAHMVRQIEATQSWLETITYQLNTMTHEEAQVKLGGPIALLKAQTSITFEFCAREAAQIFGGLAYTRGGQGAKVERLYREVRGYAIPGGSEEILLDLGVRQATRMAKL